MKLPIRCDKSTAVCHTYESILQQALGLALLIGSLSSGTALAADASGEARQVHFREPHATSYTITPSGAANSSALTLQSVQDGSWTRATVDGTTNTVSLGSRVVLKLEPGQKLDDFIAGTGLTLSRTVGSNFFILQAASSEAAIAAAESLAQKPGVIASYPVMRRPMKRFGAYATAPNDTLFAQQWNLENRGSDHNLAGPDLNVRAAWPVTRGEGVLVAVVDDGFQLDHPDLEAPAAGAPHFDFYRGTADGSPKTSDDDHGTCVAGLIGAEANNDLGISGVAPGVHMASWVIWGPTVFGQDNIASDEQLMDMFQYSSNRVSVQNHSWGSSSLTQTALDALSDVGIENAVKHGRDGKGVVIVRAGGNERESLTNANDDGYGSDPRVIAVAAVRKDGRACTYSSPGASLLVGAPSGDLMDTDDDGITDSEDPNAPDVLSTDRTGDFGYDFQADYTGFNGTSASSPQITGVVALILAANPSLTYRDVQQILALSARHYDFDDPDVKPNGAGLFFSHNVGFGVPDSGVAVTLAKLWTNRPAMTTARMTNTARQDIPDDSLRLVCSGSGVTTALTSIHSIPTLGLNPDDPISPVPIVYVGQANDEITQDLHGKAALIQRGVSFFSDKIARAARAGALFAVIYNNTGTNQLQAMGGTTFVPIPAVGIGKNDGDALASFLTSHPSTTAKLQLTPAVYRFNLTNTLSCEHVGIRLKTTHSNRGDVRVTLVSPSGTRSVLQALNGDTAAGPDDWTYWSTRHFFESSAGEWRLEVSDEGNPLSRRGTTITATGAVTYAELIVQGVAITDTDHDGLDDAWEMKWFGSLKNGPKDDPDQDGFNNAREQLMNTNPARANADFKIDIAVVTPGFWRFSWPSREGSNYVLESSPSLGSPFANIKTVPGKTPITEYVIPAPSGANRFFDIRTAGTLE